MNFFRTNILGNNLFGNNIEVSCEYCHKSQEINGITICRANREIVNGKCSGAASEQQYHLYSHCSENR